MSKKHFKEILLVVLILIFVLPLMAILRIASAYNISFQTKLLLVVIIAVIGWAVLRNTKLKQKLLTLPKSDYKKAAGISILISLVLMYIGKAKQEDIFVDVGFIALLFSILLMHLSMTSQKEGQIKS